MHIITDTIGHHYSGVAAFVMLGVAAVMVYRVYDTEQCRVPPIIEMLTIVSILNERMNEWTKWQSHFVSCSLQLKIIDAVDKTKKREALKKIKC